MEKLRRIKKKKERSSVLKQTFIDDIYCPGMEAIKTIRMLSRKLIFGNQEMPHVPLEDCGQTG